MKKFFLENRLSDTIRHATSVRLKRTGRIFTTGFTLIETLMAMFVLMVGVVTGFAVISQAIHTSPVSRQQLIAASLAQEGIEIARNIRDRRLLIIGDGIKQNANPSRDWTPDLAVCAAKPTEFRTMAELNDFDDVSSGWVLNAQCGTLQDRPGVYQEPTTGFYANACDNKGLCKKSGWIDTGFRRIFNIAKLPDDTCTTNCTEVRVKVKVYWNTSVDPSDPAAIPCPADNCIEVEDRFTNWVDYLESFL